jgi:DNA polymerase-1
MGEEKSYAITGDRKVHARFQKRMRGVVDYMEQVMKQVRKTGRVRTLAGTVLYVDRERAYAGVNYIIQGTAGDILKEAIVRTDAIAEGSEGVLLPIHDELIIEVPAARREVVKALPRYRDAMASAGEVAGVRTPVHVAVVVDDWSSPVSVSDFLGK